MLELDNLLAEVEFARRTGGQTNLTNRYLRCQTKVVGRRRAAGDDGFTATSVGVLNDETFDACVFFGGRRWKPSVIATIDRAPMKT